MSAILCVSWMGSLRKSESVSHGAGPCLLGETFCLVEGMCAFG